MGTDLSQALPSEKPLPDVLRFLLDKSFTGSCCVNTYDVERKIVFTDGKIRSARSYLEEEKFGLWLVQRGLISEGDRALALLSQQGDNSVPIGTHLINKGCIDPEILTFELEQLAQVIIRQAATTIPNSIKIVEQDTHDQPDCLPNLITLQIILLASREVRNSDDMLLSLGSLEQSVQVMSTLSPQQRKLPFTPSEAFLLSRIDTAHTLSDAISISALPQDQAISMLYTFNVTGVIEIGCDLKSSKKPDPSETRDLPSDGKPTVDENTLTIGQIERRRRIRSLAEKANHVNHYEALSLETDAGSAVIEEAWLAIDKEFGSDYLRKDHLLDLHYEIETILGRARNAFEVLINSSTRMRYDEILKDIAKSEEEKRGDKRQPVSMQARYELVEANIKRADELLREGEHYQAIQLLEQACALEPRPAELTRLAQLLQRNPLWSNRALSYLQKAVEVDPSFVEGWLEIAVFWHQKNNSHQERRSLETALELAPKNTRAVEMYTSLVGKKGLRRFLSGLFD